MLLKMISFKDLAKNRDKLPVLFISSIEQHGPYLPLGTDTLIAEALMERLEKQMEKKAIFLPVLPFGCSKEHAGFPGTISIEYSTYTLFIKDIIRSVFEAGFKKFVLISSHGGNNSVARLIQIDNNYGSKKKVELLMAFDDDTEEKCIELFSGSEMHAGSSESSIIAALDSNNVEFVGIRSNSKFAPDQEGIFSSFSTKEITCLGILNFSAKLEINPEKGEQLLEFVANNLSQKLNRLIERKSECG